MESCGGVVVGELTVVGEFWRVCGGADVGELTVVGEFLFLLSTTSLSFLLLFLFLDLLAYHTEV